LRAYRSTSEEIRALTNADLLLVLHEQEMEDSVRFQKLRVKWERRLKEGIGYRVTGYRVRPRTKTDPKTS